MKKTNKGPLEDLFDEGKINGEKYFPKVLKIGDESASLNEQLAILSHYYRNLNANEGSKFRNPAMKIIESINKEREAKNGCHGIEEEVVRQNIIDVIAKAPFKEKDETNFTFIDLFAGIGGFRLAMQRLGGKCVFSSEWDTQAQKTYFMNYGEVPFGDITQERIKHYIPNHFDVLCAGFPCQAFSQAGKKLGFGETRGTLFFEVEDILRRKRPRAFFLENVKGLVMHDKGRTIATILHVLRDTLGYYVPDPQILNAMDFGVPQHRERIYIVGFRNQRDAKRFNYPLPFNEKTTIKDILEEHKVSPKYYLSNTYWETLIRHKERHEAKGNGFGYEIRDINGVSNAIVVGGMGRERNLIIDKRQKNLTPVTKIKGEINTQGIRRMTPREWARLQGYPDNFIICVADASAYKQFGNSVAVPAIQATAAELLKAIGVNH